MAGNTLISTGETYHRQFIVRDINRAPVVADALPTATVIVNGLDQATVVTVVDNGGGEYDASFTAAGFASPDTVQMRIEAVVAGVPIRAIADVSSHIVRGARYTFVAIIRDRSGEPQDADVAPTAVVMRNNVLDATAPVTVSTLSPHLPGEYLFDFTASTASPIDWNDGDEIEVNIAATVDGVSIINSQRRGQVFDSTNLGVVEIDDFIVTADVQDIVLATDDEDIVLATDDQDIQVELDD